MDFLNYILTALLTSTIVSTIVSYIFKSWFETRLKHHFERELEKIRHSYQVDMERLRHSYIVDLEKLKTNLAIDADVAQEITGRRLDAYPRLVELVYRVRNLAREIISTEASIPILRTELTARANELEEAVYSYRIDLDRDGIFAPIHAYKNESKTFGMLIRDLEHYQAQGQADNTKVVFGQLSDLYKDMELQHTHVIESLSVHTNFVTRE